MQNEDLNMQNEVDPLPFCTLVQSEKSAFARGRGWSSAFRRRVRTGPPKGGTPTHAGYLGEMGEVFSGCEDIDG